MIRKRSYQSINELMKVFRKGKQPYDACVMSFVGVENKDVYNITAPFLEEGQEVVAGRVEDRDSEHSKVVFFEKKNSHWVPRTDLPTFVLQDPFVTHIHGEIVFGGVEIFQHPDDEEKLWWQTKFFRGKSISRLKPFAVGPKGMKDIRLVQIEDGRIGVFSRPQGDIGGKGTIGFIIIETLDDLNEKVIWDAPLLDQFHQGEWGGVNEAHLLSNGLVGVLGHIAKFSEDNVRHYYPMVFTMNPQTGEYTPMEIIVERKNFMKGPSKRPDLYDVLFSGGLMRKSNGTAVLYVGISDAQAGYITIKDPFCKYEQSL